jgi:hypothetical protein
MLGREHALTRTAKPEACVECQYLLVREQEHQVLIARVGEHVLQQAMLQASTAVAGVGAHRTELPAPHSSPVQHEVHAG